MDTIQPSTTTKLPAQHPKQRTNVFQTQRNIGVHFANGRDLPETARSKAKIKNGKEEIQELSGSKKRKSTAKLRKQDREWQRKTALDLKASASIGAEKRAKAE